MYIYLYLYRSIYVCVYSFIDLPSAALAAPVPCSSEVVNDFITAAISLPAFFARGN